MEVKIISQKESENVKKLLEVYKENKLHARVFALSNECIVEQVVLFDESKHKFQLIKEVKKYGVSTNLKIYYRTKRTNKLFANNLKFYMSDRTNQLMPLCYINMYHEFTNEFYTRYPWLKMFHEYGINISFNTCATYNVFNIKKLLTHIYKCPYPKAKVFHDNFKDKPISIFRQMQKWMANLDNLNAELLHDFNFLRDCTNMAMKLNRKINISWSVKRLKSEHDDMSYEITKILLSHDNKDLKINDIYLEFSEEMGIEIIKSNFQLALEGMRQKHCVANYSEYINRGRCAIFKYKGFTIELKIKGGFGLVIGQFRGYMNCAPTDSIKTEFHDILDKFNESKKLDYKSEIPYYEYEDTPF